LLTQESLEKIPRVEASPSPLLYQNTVPEVQIANHSGDVIELNNIEEMEKELVPQREIKKHHYVIAVLIIVLLGYSLIDWLSVDEKELRLLRPNYGKGPQLSAEDIEKLTQQGVLLYQKDDYSSYLEAQAIFVRILESQPNKMTARGMLCLTQRELWPYVKQDSKDQETFFSLVRSTKALDPIGEFGSACEVARLLATGKVNEARGIVDYYLSQPEMSNNPIFIAFKAEVLGRSMEYGNAILFLDTAQKHWPHWVKLYSLRGQYELLDGQSEVARNTFSKVIKMNEKHKIAYLNLGIIEYRFLKNSDAALEYLKTGINLNSKVPRSLEVKGYQTLAKIFKDRRDLDNAKKYIEVAYTLQPGDPEIKALYHELGGDSNASKIGLKQNEMVYLGDQYVNLGDCLAAQAEYKAAFEMDPKNAIAAMKAAKCLWELAQPHEAIEWLKKAIKADPFLVEASVTLADYYSQRFDFAMASEVLARAAQKNPNHAEILKGYGLIEYRRNNLKAAVGYFKRSLKIFDHNEQVLVLLAKATAGLGNFDEAQNYSIRALEIDPTNIEAMVVYGKNLAQYKGVSAGLNYLNEQIKKFSHTIELRIAVAEVYLELERYAEAERIYSQIVDYKPKSKKGWIGLGKSYQAQLKMADAIRAFIEASILDVSDAEPLFLLGKLYLEIDKIDKALNHFERAINANPNYPNVYYYSGRAALKKGDLKLALQYAMKERQKNPNIAESYLLAAEIYDINQEYQLCAAEYQKAVKFRPSGSEIYVKMARCYRLAGEIDIAENMLNVAASIESGQPDIYREQGAIFEQKSDYRAAIAAYEKYLLLSPNAKDKLMVERKILELQK
jgi:tetratricopeptide (TPR) repeat protein